MFKVMNTQAVSALFTTICLICLTRADDKKEEMFSFEMLGKYSSLVSNTHILMTQVFSI